jgi:hypothetical protein
MSTAKDLMAGDFSRNLLSVWDVVLTITIICCSVALFGVEYMLIEGITEAITVGEFSLLNGVVSTIVMQSQIGVLGVELFLLTNTTALINNNTFN